MLLISISLLLVNCQKDETFKEEINQAEGNHLKSHLVRKTLNEKDIKNNTALTNILSRLNSDYNETAGRGLDSISSDYYILTDTAIYIESDDGTKHSYTFGVFRDSIDSTFENLVMSSKEANFYEFYLVKYNTTQQEKEALINGQPVDLTNKIDFVELDEYGSTTEVINKELVCTTVTAQYCTCDVHDASTGFNGCQCYESLYWTYCEGGGNGPFGEGGVNDPGNGPGDTGDPGSTTGGLDNGDTFDTQPYVPTPAVIRWKNFRIFKLNGEQQEWLTDILDNQPDVYEDIHNFLENDISPNGIMAPDTNYNEEAIQFAIESIIGIHFGGEVDFDNEIIKDPSFIGTQMDCVLNALISMENNIWKRASEAFTPKDAEYRIKFTTYNNPNDNANARTSLPNSNGIIEIRFNLANISATSLEIAMDILHETFHAELHRIHFSNNAPPNSLPQSQFNRFEQLWNYYNLYDPDPNTTASSSEHAFIAEFLINPIAQGLREFDDYSHPVDSYKFPLWDGLPLNITNFYMSNEELSALAALYNNVINDNHEPPCN